VPTREPGALLALGCARDEVRSEDMAALDADGRQLTAGDDADIVILNSGFSEKANRTRPDLVGPSGVALRALGRHP
jgi:tRNA A37 methylthiotransferase MiaB